MLHAGANLPRRRVSEVLPNQGDAGAGERIVVDSERGRDRRHLVRRERRKSVERALVEIDPDQLHLLVQGVVRIFRRDAERQGHGHVTGWHAEVVHRTGQEQKWGPRVVDAGEPPHHRLHAAGRIPRDAGPRPELQPAAWNSRRVYRAADGEDDAAQLTEQDRVIGLRCRVELSVPA